jgi:hypothetical protein
LKNSSVEGHQNEKKMACTPAAIEGHLLSLLDGTAALVRASRIPEDEIASAATAGEGTAAAAAALAGPAAQIPVAAERIAAAAAGLSAAASDLKRRAGLADPVRRARAVATARQAALERAEATSAELSCIADDAADLARALHTHVAGSVRPPQAPPPPAADPTLTRLLRAVGPGSGGLPGGSVIVG